jgi:hypothetical protein
MSRRRNPEKSNVEKEGTRNGTLSSYPRLRKLAVRKGTKTTGDVR